MNCNQTDVREQLKYFYTEELQPDSSPIDDSRILTSVRAGLDLQMLH